MKAVSPKAAWAGCSFRNEDLTIARQELDQIAFTMANRMNEQHAERLPPDSDEAVATCSPGGYLKLTPMHEEHRDRQLGAGQHCQLYERIGKLHRHQ